MKKIFILGIALLFIGIAYANEYADSSANGYNLTIQGSGLYYNNTNQSFWGNGSSFLSADISKVFKNVSVEIHFRGFNDFPNKANTGVFMIGNGSLTGNQYWIVHFISNSSHGSYGRITLDARNITGTTVSLTNTATVSYLKNVTSFINLTLNIRGTNISIYINGAYLGYSTLPGGFSQGTITKIYIMRANTNYLNGSVDYFKITDETGAVVAEYNMDSDCKTPYANMSLNENTILCAGESYYLNISTGSLLKNNIWTNKSNIYLDCNGSTIYGDGMTNFTTGVLIQHDNITVKNCNIRGYSMAIQASYYSLPAFVPFYNATIYNVNISENGGLGGIFTDGLRSLTVHDLRCSNFTDYYERDIGSHCIYISGGNDSKTANSGSLYNINITGVTGSGIKMNADGLTYNISINNVTCALFNQTRGDDYCVHLAEVENITVSNVLCLAGVDACIVLNRGTNITHYAHDVIITNNNFSNAVTGIWFRRAGVNNISVYNNYYSPNEKNDFRIGNNEANITMQLKYYNETGTRKLCKGYSTCVMNLTNIVMNNITIKLY